MSQSLSKNYIHLTFSTKYRKDSIRKEDLPEMFSYISGILKNIDCPSIIVGGITNHIHVLCVLNKNIALTKMVEEIKKSSSKWIKGKGIYYQWFSWQEGYGAFSVSQSKVDVVTRYICRQEEHHKKISFEDELKMFLKEHGVEYNEQYL
ncbi:transposase [Bacteroides timonensis]|uniref:transposase n=1 Tax=Bacteroides timonensis TaxID=1470345 RepID=UPI0005C71280|nr:transposase [Bacteroides timonensis]